MENVLEQSTSADALPNHLSEQSSIGPPCTPLEFALRYARNGWRILPLHTVTPQGCSCGKPDCPKTGKHARLANWSHDASSDEVAVTEWWTRWPSANIGLILDGLIALDVDPRHGGLESLGELEQTHGRLDRYALQRSGSGGLHFLFAPTEEAKVVRGFRPGLDFLLGSGCYIVVEPSRHASGGTYSWMAEPHPLSTHRETIIVTPAPAWLIDAANGMGNTQCAPGVAKPTDPASRVPIARLIEDALSKVRAGEGRNNTGLWLFTQLRDNGYSREESAAVKRDWVKQANDAGGPNADRYTLGEADDSLRQAFRRAAREPWKQSTPGRSIVQEMEEEIVIQGGHHFARDKGDLLYHFESGTYRPNGVEFLRGAVREYCESHAKGTAWSLELPEKLAGWILAKSPKLWDCPPLDTVNLKNGLLDVGTRTLRPHDPEFLSPIQIEASFDPSAGCPAIEKFIVDTFPDDARHIPYEMAAWLMLPDTSLQKAVLCVGEGSNGKSVFLTLLADFLGKENLSAVDLHKIESDKFAAARLYGKLANICADLPTAALSGTSLFKAITGGDYINAERKYQTSFEFRPYARLVFSANTPPRSDDSTHGFFRRWLVIPFTRVFDEKSPGWVPHTVLKENLRAELPGFLNRALDVLPAIRAAGTFTEPASLKRAREEFRRTTDPLSVWLDANTVEVSEGFVAKNRLRDLYTVDCRDQGRAIVPDNVFTERLRRLRPRVTTKQRRINGKPLWCFVGIGLKIDASEGPQNEQLEF